MKVEDAVFFGAISEGQTKIKELEKSTKEVFT